MIVPVANSFGSLREMNTCHAQADGKFCSGPGGQRVSLGTRTYPDNSVRLPEYLKADVLHAAKAGIVTYHHQQPEPVKDSTGKIHDPLALSHSNRSEEHYTDKKTGFRVTAHGGKVRIVTRGGEFVPHEDVYTGSFNLTRRQKTMTPDMLTKPANRADVISTYRHEVGHIMDANFKGAKSTPEVLAREIRAWTNAVEIAPNHRVSSRMVQSGLESHAYFELRRQHHLQNSMQSVSSWDRAERSARMVQNEMKDNHLDAPTLERARAMAQKVSASLARYGAVLRSKGAPAKTPKGPKPYISKRWKMGIGSGADMYRPMPGPGRGGIL